jgi:hypothetical protein
VDDRIKINTMKIKEQKQSGVVFKAGVHVSLEDVMKQMKTLKSDKIYFDLNNRTEISIIELIEREETKEEKTERETREKQIALEREQNEKAMLETLKKKYEKDTDN